MIRRVFVGVSNSLSVSLRQWLQTNKADSTWLVVETASAARRLRKALNGIEILDAEAASEALAPSLRSVDPIFRREFTRTSIDGLSQVDRSAFFPSTNEGDPIVRESEIDALDALFAELCSSGFDAEDVCLSAMDVLSERERRRWEVLAKIDAQVRELAARRIPKPMPPPSRLVLAAIGDLPGNLSRWIHEHHDSTEVVALVAADEADAARFNDVGAVNPSPWIDALLPLALHAMIVATSPSAQAAAALDPVEQAESESTIVAVLDDSLEPIVAAEACRRDLCKPSGPRVFRACSPFRLLDAVADYLELDGVAGFSTLVRHTELERTLDRTSSIKAAEAIADLDRLAAERTPGSVKQFWNPRWSESDRNAEKSVDALFKAVHGILDGLAGESRALSAWSDPILDFMECIYGPRREWQLPPLVRLRDALESAALSTLNDSSQPIEIWEALRRMTTRFADEKFEREAAAGKLQLVDWPDVVWSEATSIVLIGFNEGRLPRTRRSSFFLPDAVRERLRAAADDGRRVADNDFQYAVDAYRLCAALAGRTEVSLIAGRVGATGEPLLPSRFWFARPPEEIPERVARFYDPPKPSPKPTKVVPRKPMAEPFSVYLPPKPFENQPPISSLRVTAFRDFLACPYRFYLRHVLKLQTPDLPSDELTGAQFGTLAHDVLEKLALPELIAETDPVRIFERLSGFLDERAHSMFGGDLSPAVRLQVEQLRTRFHRFTTIHASDVANGWRIDQVETAIEDVAGMLDVDGEPFRITGRIDRIDVNGRTGAWRLLDYKTGDSADAPDKTHRKQGEWVDLQLPLYWHLTERVRGEGGHVGYVLLGKDASKIETSLAPWNREEVEAAVEVAKNVVRRIRRNDFWPPTNPPPQYFGEFAGLCRDGIRV